MNLLTQSGKQTSAKIIYLHHSYVLWLSAVFIQWCIFLKSKSYTTEWVSYWVKYYNKGKIISQIYSPKVCLQLRTNFDVHVYYTVLSFFKWEINITQIHDTSRKVASIKKNWCKPRSVSPAWITSSCHMPGKSYFLKKASSCVSINTLGRVYFWQCMQSIRRTEYDGTQNKQYVPSDG